MTPALLKIEPVLHKRKKQQIRNLYSGKKMQLNIVVPGFSPETGVFMAHYKFLKQEVMGISSLTVWRSQTLLCCTFSPLLGAPSCEVQNTSISPLQLLRHFIYPSVPLSYSLAPAPVDLKDLQFSLAS